MHWYNYLAWFFGGAFLANCVPHLTNGISGRAFHSPFAKPPGKGLSSPTVNILWGLFNLALSYLLLVQVGAFNLHALWDVVALGAGMLWMSFTLSRVFGPLQAGAPAGQTASAKAEVAAGR